MKLLIIILLFFSLSASGQDFYNPNPNVSGVVYDNPNSYVNQKLEKIITQNNQLLDIFFQTEEANHKLAMKLPSKLIQLYIYNAYIGELAGSRMDSLAVYNIIVSDTCTGTGLSNEFNIVVDYASDWINLNMVEWEITELYIADDALETYKDSPYYIKKCIFNSALKMIHRGVARERNLL